MCLEIYEIDPAKFISASGLAWQVPSKRTKVKLDLSTDSDIILMVEINGIILKVFDEEKVTLFIKMQKLATGM